MKQFKKHLFFLAALVFSLSIGCTPDVDPDVLTGKFNPAKKSGFTVLPGQYSLKKEIYLDNRALEGFVAMAKEAEKEGIRLYVVSGFRSFYDQKSIWEGKFNGARLVEGKDLSKSIPDHLQRSRKILEFSAFPGGSRHHWGTEVDIVFDKSRPYLENSVFEQGYGAEVYHWLDTNAAKFGFCQPYKGTPLERDGQLKEGHKEEKWHWSYLPVSGPYYKAYHAEKTGVKPAGFMGSESLNEIYSSYTGNVNQACRKSSFF